MSKIKIIAITGGSGSGKTTASKMLQNLLGSENCKIISQDNYYQDQSNSFQGDGSVNFDSPEAIDFALMHSHLSAVSEGKSIQTPLYDFVTHSRKKETNLFIPTQYIIVDGTLVLFDEKLRKLFDTVFFLDIPEEIRFARRLKRDVEERGRTPEGVRTQFYNLVKPMHDLYVDPVKIHANYIAHNDNEVKIFVEKLVSELIRKENL